MYILYLGPKVGVFLPTCRKGYTFFDDPRGLEGLQFTCTFYYLLSTR